MVKGFNIYRNDKFVKFLDSRSKKARKEFIESNEAVIGTHMGEWVRKPSMCPVSGKPAFEFEYATTVGVYFRFVPAGRG